MDVLLKERSRDELEAALLHLEEIIKRVENDTEKAPGPGQQPILDLFRHDRKKIKQELDKRSDD